MGDPGEVSTTSKTVSPTDAIQSEVPATAPIATPAAPAAEDNTAPSAQCTDQFCQDCVPKAPDNEAYIACLKKNGFYILPESYGERKVPDPFEVEEGKEGKFKKDFVKFKIPALNFGKNRNPEAILKKVDPKAHALYKQVEWRFERTNITREDFFSFLERLTQATKGVKFESGYVSGSPLADIISNFDIEYWTKESLNKILDVTLEAIKGKKKLHFIELTDFSNFVWSVAFTVQHDNMTLQNDIALIDKLAAFYLKLKGKVDIGHSTGDEIGWLYDISGGDLDKFSHNLDAVADYLLAMNDIQPGLSDGFASLKVLLRTLGREEVEKSGVRAASKNILDYLKTLAERGERHLDDALTAFEFHGAPATPELLSRLLKLHELYGIVNFSRYMDGKYDFDMIDMLIANGDPEKDKDKPLAVVFVARKGNFIFDTFSIGNFRKNLQDLAKSHKLVVYEVATEDGAIENMKKAVQLTAKGKAAFVGLAGHGGDLTTDFGQDVWDSVIDDKDKIRGRGAIDYGNTAEKMYIDVTDKDFFAAIEPFIEKDAIVLLYSCLTGKGGSEAVNLANTTAWYLSGRRVYAPTDSTIGTDLVLSASGLVIDINFLFDWDAKTPGTYRGIHF